MHQICSLEANYVTHGHNTHSGCTTAYLVLTRNLKFELHA